MNKMSLFEKKQFLNYLQLNRNEICSNLKKKKPFIYFKSIKIII